LRGHLSGTTAIAAWFAGTARARVIARTALRRALVNEERNGLFPGRNIAIHARSFFPVLIVGIQLRFARQVARVLIQIVVGVVGKRPRFGRRTRGTGRPSLFARAAVARTPIAPAPAASAPATARTLGLFRSGFGRGFVCFFKGPFVKCGLVRQLFDVFQGAAVGTLFVEHFRFGFLARSFVAHMRLPIHRPCRSLSSRTRTPPAPPAPRRTSAFFNSSLAGFLLFLAFVDAFALWAFFKTGRTLFHDRWLIPIVVGPFDGRPAVLLTAAWHGRLRRAARVE
jgi:hypothetical protein